jgi:hypothetical protein
MKITLGQLVCKISGHTAYVGQCDRVEGDLREYCRWYFKCHPNEDKGDLK